MDILRKLKTVEACHGSECVDMHTSGWRVEARIPVWRIVVYVNRVGE